MPRITSYVCLKVFNTTELPNKDCSQVSWSQVQTENFLIFSVDVTVHCAKKYAIPEQIGGYPICNFCDATVI
jgi:hypothetical protein